MDGKAQVHPIRARVTRGINEYLSLNRSFHYVVYSRLPFTTQRPRRVYMAPPGSRLRKNRCLTMSDFTIVGGSTKEDRSTHREHNHNPLANTTNQPTNNQQPTNHESVICSRIAFAVNGQCTRV